MPWSWAARFAALGVLWLAALSACLGLRNQHFQCGPGQLCPDGFGCAPDGYCWLGWPSAPFDGSVARDPGPEDASAPLDGIADQILDDGQPIDLVSDPAQQDGIADQ